jgi:hypothetical protein
MALLSVAEVMYDPDLVEKYSVRRRQQVVDIHGRSTSVETLLTGQIGTINAGNPNNLERGSPDYEYATNTISVVTAFDLFCEMDGYLPDIVVWGGTNYTVVEINQYPQFGPGFSQATCTSTDRNDKMPVKAAGLSLNIKTNSGLSALL